MGQAFRGAKPLEQGMSPPQNPKWASLGVKAARDAMPEREVEHGMSEETSEHHLDPDTTAKLVIDHLSKKPDYYAKEDKLGRDAAEFAMNPRDIRSQPKKDPPGKGETSVGIGGVPLQGSC
jgi:hypothetical protein